MGSIQNILEPSCGSCEFINAIHQKYPEKQILGIEHNHHIYQNIKHFSNENITLLHGDFLKYKSSPVYNLIIGNPPYFVIGKQEVHQKYLPYFDGRPNIFILFINYQPTKGTTLKIQTIKKVLFYLPTVLILFGAVFCGIYAIETHNPYLGMLCVILLFSRHALKDYIEERTKEEYREYFDREMNNFKDE